eukprot:29398-Pelagococcus_subviridis.AAC.6
MKVKNTAPRRAKIAPLFSSRVAPHRPRVRRRPRRPILRVVRVPPLPRPAPRILGQIFHRGHLVLILLPRRVAHVLRARGGEVRGERVREEALRLHSRLLARERRVVLQTSRRRLGHAHLVELAPRHVFQRNRVQRVRVDLLDARVRGDGVHHPLRLIVLHDRHVRLHEMLIPPLHARSRDRAPGLEQS